MIRLLLADVLLILNQAKHCSSQSIGMKFLGSVEASVVGLKHRFHTTADSNGAQLKTLAAFLGKCRENAFGMSEVVLRRNTNIPADANAVSVLICDLDEFSEGGMICKAYLYPDVGFPFYILKNCFFRRGIKI